MSKIKDAIWPDQIKHPNGKWIQMNWILNTLRIIPPTVILGLIIYSGIMWVTEITH